MLYYLLYNYYSYHDAILQLMDFLKQVKTNEHVQSLCIFMSNTWLSWVTDPDYVTLRCIRHLVQKSAICARGWPNNGKYMDGFVCDKGPRCQLCTNTCGRSKRSLGHFSLIASGSWTKFNEKWCFNSLAPGRFEQKWTLLMISQHWFR